MPPPFWRKNIRDRFPDFDGPVDRWQIIHYYAPSTICIDVGVARAGTGAPQGDRSQGVNGYVMNTITPETERTSHYFWAFMRNYRLDSQLITTQLREGVRGVFAEDEAMLAAQQAAIDANPDHEFYSLNIDAGGMWVRRILDRMLEAEDRDPRRACRRPAMTTPVAARVGSRPRRRDRARVAQRRPPDHRRAPGSWPGRTRQPRRRAGASGRRVRRPVLLGRGVLRRRRAADHQRAAGARSRAAARRSCTRCRAGDELEVTQPLQNFPLRVGAPRYVLLAGGIGITAVAEMARVLRHVGADYTLVYVGRSRERMAYAVELAELHGDRLRLHVDAEGTPLDVDEPRRFGRSADRALHVRPDPADGRRAPQLAGHAGCRRRTCATRPSAAAAGSRPRSSWPGSPVAVWRPRSGPTRPCSRR